MDLYTPIHFKKWIEENQDCFKPPVGNKVVWKNREFIIMVVGGPNSRTDYHVNEGEEFFYQLKGDINLKVVDKEGNFRDIPIKEGEIYLLPPLTPHSPQRPANTLGLVVERQRRPEEKDGFQWYCKKCGTKLYEEFFHLTDIEKQLPPVFERFYSSKEHTICPQCKTDNGRH
ncbi:MAG: 3-hydroxyanthranilate 3,4-dioxygenase [Bdellovibrio sp.]|nr:MAG: 3-hydroxyanthranilate 3,4-dioxygenase [Bdellovibrio sp.]